MQNQPLNDAEFDVIENTLLQYGDDHLVLNHSELDGYLAALVSSPAQVDIAEWFPAIWGGQNPEWQSPEECRQFIDLCVRHINTLAQQLSADPSAFHARFEQTEHQQQMLTLAEEWCFGYLRGVAVGNWAPMPAPQAALLQAIIDCAEQDNFELPADLDLDQHRQQVAAIEPAARALHQYWLEQR
ncbi:UPF0149 family protein [Pseudomonas sp. Fl4BN1]|uniref:UPF0149 family protein n=1 Tax=Pseudomonas sp. Fl4BN1 TaxID=2697651 RepID=UPI0013783640|nr:UPF0149 family protein [Pseudomonas sp. Fl4BN1]NBF08973.1 UPF0149 family protein [Pseudomonas sp. Fl4BN1]